MLNKVNLIGNIGQEPKIAVTKEGKEIANFSLATSETWKNKTGEKQTKTEWHNIVVFSQGLVGIIKNYVNKGSKLYIEGKLQTRKWTDKNGVDKYTTEIVLQGFDSKLILLNSKSSLDKSFEKIEQAFDEDEALTADKIDALDKANRFDDVPF